MVRACRRGSGADFPRCLARGLFEDRSRQPRFYIQGTDIFGARVSATVLDVPRVTLYAEPLDVTAFNGRYAALASNGTTTLVAASIARGYLQGRTWSPDGTLGDPVLLARRANGQARPAIAFNGTTYLAAWEDTRLPQSAIYASRLLPTGQPINQPSSISGDRSASNPRVASDGQAFLTAFELSPPRGSGTLNLRRLQADGTPLDPAPFIFDCQLHGSPSLSGSPAGYAVAKACDNRPPPLSPPQYHKFFGSTPPGWAQAGLFTMSRPHTGGPIPGIPIRPGADLRALSRLRQAHFFFRSSQDPSRPAYMRRGCPYRSRGRRIGSSIKALPMDWWPHPREIKFWRSGTTAATLWRRGSASMGSASIRKMSLFRRHPAIRRHLSSLGPEKATLSLGRTAAQARMRIYAARVGADGVLVDGPPSSGGILVQPNTEGLSDPSIAAEGTQRVAIAYSHATDVPPFPDRVSRAFARFLDWGEPPEAGTDAASDNGTTDDSAAGDGAPPEDAASDATDLDASADLADESARTDGASDAGVVAPYVTDAAGADASSAAHTTHPIAGMLRTCFDASTDSAGPSSDPAGGCSVQNDRTSDR